MSTRQQTQVNTLALTTAALLGLGALTACGGGSAPPPTTAATASAARSAAVPLSATARARGAEAALRSARSVHVDDAISTSAGSVKYSVDAMADGGRQVITFGGTGHATILFIAGVGYLKADAQTLTGFFGLDQSQANQVAGQWIALRRGDKLGGSDYDAVTSGITLSSLADEVAISGTPTPTAPATIAGRPVVGVQGPLPASDQLPASAREVLYMTDDSLLRPVLSKVTGGGIKSQMSFSQWDETLHLTAPSDTIPATSITPISSIT